MKSRLVLQAVARVTPLQACGFLVTSGLLGHENHLSLVASLLNSAPVPTAAYKFLFRGWQERGVGRGQGRLSPRTVSGLRQIPAPAQSQARRRWLIKGVKWRKGLTFIGFIKPQS